MNNIKLQNNTASPTANLANKNSLRGNTGPSYSRNNRGGQNHGRFGNRRRSKSGVPLSGALDSTKSTQNRTTFTATPEMGKDDAWYVDSGASNHVSVDTSTMTQKNKYTGKDDLIVGNGSQLTIDHIGNATFKSINNYPLILKDILHVPKITKNLISISKLTTDNDVIVEFTPDYCYVKDKQTKEMVLQGRLEGGLYRLDKAENDSNKSYKLLHPIQFQVSTQDFY
uniref:Retrovirus-related Pol polyprotein from transposon TNT 1-94-like beta-barrel domain-containing protein n=1 Tax=Cannabis sativa TaxID=3483 RepID=A0A803PUR2_CANSA